MNNVWKLDGEREDGRVSPPWLPWNHRILNKFDDVVRSKELRFYPFVCCVHGVCASWRGTLCTFVATEILCSTPLAVYALWILFKVFFSFSIFNFIFFKFSSCFHCCYDDADSDDIQARVAIWGYCFLIRILFRSQYYRLSLNFHPKQWQNPDTESEIKRERGKWLNYWIEWFLNVCPVRCTRMKRKKVSCLLQLVRTRIWSSY